MDVFKYYLLLETSIKITSVLYEQNKSNETIKRHKSGAVVYHMPIDEMQIDIWFISSL